MKDLNERGRVGEQRLPRRRPKPVPAEVHSRCRHEREAALLPNPILRPRGAAALATARRAPARPLEVVALVQPVGSARTEVGELHAEDREGHGERPEAEERHDENGARGHGSYLILCRGCWPRVRSMRRSHDGSMRGVGGRDAKDSDEVAKWSAPCMRGRRLAFKRSFRTRHARDASQPSTNLRVFLDRYQTGFMSECSWLFPVFIWAAEELYSSASTTQIDCYIRSHEHNKRPGRTGLLRSVYMVFPSNTSQRKERPMREEPSIIGSPIDGAELEQWMSVIGSTPTVAVVYISPADAVRLLELNTRNRGLKELTGATKLSESMGSGHWKFNGESVKFCDDGTVLDGQHRLVAISRQPADWREPILCVLGLDKDTQKTIDKGIKRTLGDSIEMDGLGRERLRGIYLASISKHLVGMELHKGVLLGVPHATATLDDETVCAWVRDHVDSEIVPLDNRVPLQSSAAKIEGVTPMAFGIVAILLNRVDQDAAAEFLRSLPDNIGFYEGDPRQHLKRWLVENHKTGMQLYQIVAVFFITWNAWRRQEDFGSGRNSKRPFRIVTEKTEGGVSKLSAATFPKPI